MVLRLKKLLTTETLISYSLIRWLVGLIFVSEGIQKFLYPEAVGAGRFAKIGFANPEWVAFFVGSSEIFFGILVLLGILTRLCIIPIFIIMVTAIVSTKVPILIEAGFWKMAHYSRTDFSMLVCSIFIFIQGAGKYSLDSWLLRKLE